MRWKCVMALVLCVASAAAGVAPWLYPAVLPGDANGDLAVDVLDIQYVITALLNETGASTAAADVNGDGRLDILDYQAVLGRANSGEKTKQDAPRQSKQPVIQAVLSAGSVWPLPSVIPACVTPEFDGHRAPLATPPFLHAHRLKHERYVLGLRTHAPPALS